MRPRTLIANGKDWGHWIAFVLRYVQPLLVNNPPIETKPFMDVMHNRPEIVKTLMFGSEEMVMAALPIAYEAPLNCRDRLTIPELNPEQQTLFDLVKKDIQSAQDRTLTGWGWIAPHQR